MGQHRQPQTLLFRQRAKYRIRQAAGFRAEKQNIVVSEAGVRILTRCPGAERPHRSRPVFQATFQTDVQVGVAPGIRPLMIVEPGPLQFGVVEREAQRLDQMQLSAGICANTDDVSGIGRDFRLIEHYLQGHQDLPAIADSLSILN